MENDFSNFDNKRLNISNKFISNQGLFEQIFGDIGVAMHDLEKEKLKNILINVFGFTDVERVFPPEIDMEKVNKSLQTMFKFNTQERVEEGDLDDIGI